MSKTGLGSTMVGYGAALWASAFAGLHVVWATGWYPGLEEQQARAAFARPWFLVYDLVAAILCVCAALVAMALVRPLGRGLPRRSVGMMAWAATVLLGMRGGLAIVQAVHDAATGAFGLHPMHLWDFWFCLGALLFGLSAWKYQTRDSSR